MDDFKRFVEMIPGYLLGRLNPSDKEAFERQLDQSSDLRQELERMSLIRGGLAIYLKARGDHLSSDLLAKHATTPKLVTDEELAEINEHLPNCSTCQEDLRLCAPPDFVTKGLDYQPEPEVESNSLFSRLLAPLWRPVLTAALVLLVAIPAIYFGLQTRPDRVATVTFNIAPVSRDVRSLNILNIPDTANTIGLNFLLAVTDSTNLDCILVNEGGKVIRDWQYDGSHYPVALKVAVSYFDTGIYSLKVRTTGSEDETDWFVFRLQVALE